MATARNSVGLRCCDGRRSALPDPYSSSDRCNLSLGIAREGEARLFPSRLLFTLSWTRLRSNLSLSHIHWDPLSCLVRPTRDGLFVRLARLPTRPFFRQIYYTRIPSYVNLRLELLPSRSFPPASPAFSSSAWQQSLKTLSLGGALCVSQLVGSLAVATRKFVATKVSHS